MRSFTRRWPNRPRMEVETVARERRKDLPEAPLRLVENLQEPLHLLLQRQGLKMFRLKGLYLLLFKLFLVWPHPPPNPSPMPLPSLFLHCQPLTPSRRELALWQSYRPSPVFHFSRGYMVKSVRGVLRRTASGSVGPYGLV